jgi:hypothetical protein
MARRIVGQLESLSDGGHEKHLLLRGPVSLAMAVGAASNAIGRTTVPLWDGDSGYVDGLEIGRDTPA